ncbi:major facilitator superfamily domain-containing protein [Cercophora samala]|uniref:Major facilitator superfamily domain-containing protein n=1 Tax=Cercophora samala TaxID=330535 RepID=A0AA39Z488_9PEZI|nr:major facilitator superfamily domain-containing protein [Cercophora samala]
MNGHHSDEATALLGPSVIPPSTRNRQDPGYRIWLAIIRAASVVICLDIGRYLSLAPQTAMLESIVCRQYYAPNHSHALPEPGSERCKIEPIQSEVAFINGWMDVFDTLPALLVAIPYGALADRIGRKKVQILAITGICLSAIWERLIYWLSDTLPVRLVWLGGWWQLIGAGGSALSAMVFASVADICPSEQRTIAFSFIASTELVNQLLFLPAGAALMSVTLWVPLWAGVTFYILGLFCAVFLVQETLRGSVHSLSHSHMAESFTAKDNIRSQPRKFTVGAKQVLYWTHTNMRLILVLISCFCLTLATQCDNTLLLQYASKRLGWTIGKVGPTFTFLLSFRAAVSLFVMGVILPSASNVLLYCLHLGESVKDMRITQACGVFFALGAGIIFLAKAWLPLVAGQVIFAIGFVYKVSIRSLVIQMVKQRQLGTALAAIAISIQAGSIVGAPLLAATFQWGMRLGNLWLGMPFLVAAAFSVVALLAISIVGATTHQQRTI